MKNALRWIVLAPLAVVLLVFALTNRQQVTVSFDPFGNSPALAVTPPLFVALGLAAMIGVLAGGIATWSGQAHHRRASRKARADLERLRAENQRLSAAARDKGTALVIAQSGTQRNAA